MKTLAMMPAGGMGSTEAGGGPAQYAAKVEACS